MAGMMEWGGRSGRYYRTMLLERERKILICGIPLYPIYIVLGEFNTGKSTLINLLLKRPYSDPLVKEAATVGTHRIYRIK